MIRSAVASRQRKDRAGTGVVDQGVHTAPEVDGLRDRVPCVVGGGGIRNDPHNVLVFGDRVLDRTGATAGNQHLVALASAKRSAAARPMPELPPVTMMTFALVRCSISDYGFGVSLRAQDTVDPERAASLDGARPLCER